jgi:immune inhibitor A
MIRLARALLPLLLAGALALPVFAADAPPTSIEFPTLQALAETPLPARDRIELAQRLNGVDIIPDPPVNPPPRQVGERQVFNVTNVTDNEAFQVVAELRVVGEHIYLWVDQTADIDDADLRALADGFDRRVYPNVRALWGEEASPGVDGDPRIYGLFARGLGPTAAAYFSSDNTYPREAVPTSNAHEMFLFNADVISGSFPLTMVESIVAHEFQHMIRANLHPNQDLWLNEAFSEFTQLYLYGDFGTMAYAFLAQPGTQLNTWAEESLDRIYHYGASLMFINYFYERYGIDAVRAVSDETSVRGLEAFDRVLRDLGEPGVNEFFADWVVANGLMRPDIDDGRYGYPRLGFALPPALSTPLGPYYPLEYSDRLAQYSAAYFLLTGREDFDALTITVEAPTEVSLIDAGPLTGGWMWYSNRGDMSDTTLTRAFDLTDVDEATLEYRLWYHTERYWDYGYVMISDDDGASWTILETPNTTRENPHDTAYGPGYNAVSGGGDQPVWVEESIPLDAYIGGPVLIRFEMITDDGVNQPGMALDWVRVEAIGYESDFSTDGGGWLADGWLRTDNRLPQEGWVQLTQQTLTEVFVERWNLNETRKVELADGVQRIMLSIAPFAPVTTESMPYTLFIRAS